MSTNTAVNKCPLYDAGSTHFLSHKSGLPAKIYIEAVYKKAGSKEWMYSIISEANNGKPAYVQESVLVQRISKHTSKVYNLPEIVNRVGNGYRFCGNFTRDNAIARGTDIAKNSDIESVMLYPACDSAGNKLDDDMYGIWIRWKYVIMNDKVVNGSPIKIK